MENDITTTHQLESALKAKTLFLRDRDYVQALMASRTALQLWNDQGQKPHNFIANLAEYALQAATSCDRSLAQGIWGLIPPEYRSDKATSLYSMCLLSTIA